jgi:DNA-binding transcriptional LysR family regulator
MTKAEMLEEIDLRQLRMFIAIAETGSLSAAARRLDTVTSVVSRNLLKIEARLGVRLATRTTRRLELTEEGQIYYERIQPVLLALRDAEDEVAHKATKTTGLLRVGVPSEIGRRRIAPLVAKFANLHPDVQIRLVLSDRSLDVVQNNLDVAIRIDQPEDADVVARKLLSGRRLLCASPPYIARAGQPSTPEDLAQHDCIRLIRGERMIERWLFAENGIQREVRVRGALSTDNSEVMRAWILDGQGIGLKVDWDIEADLANGQLVECLAEYQCDLADLYAVYASRRYLSLRIRRFIDFLVNELAPQPEHIGANERFMLSAGV